MFNQKIFFLSTVFTLASWQGAFAAGSHGLDAAALGAKALFGQSQDSYMGDHRGEVAPAQKALKVAPAERSSEASPDFEGECNALVRAAQSQSPLLGHMTPDVMGHILTNLSFEDAWKFLSVDKTHHNNVDVWKEFARLHGIPISKYAEAAEQVRGEMIEGIEMRTEARKEIESGGSITSELIANLLQKAHQNPFLWDTVITALFQKGGESFRNTQLNAYYGFEVFDKVSREVRCAYLFVVAARKNSDGVPDFGAEEAQNLLIHAALGAGFGFTNDRGTATSGPDYVESVATRTNPDGTPGLGAEYAKNLLGHTSREN